MHRCTGNCRIRGEINYYSDLNILTQQKVPLKFDNTQNYSNQLNYAGMRLAWLDPVSNKIFSKTVLFNDEIVFVQKKTSHKYKTIELKLGRRPGILLMLVRNNLGPR